jgi:hypothetical protein
LAIAILGDTSFGATGLGATCFAGAGLVARDGPRFTSFALTGFFTFPALLIVSSIV